MNDDQDEYQEEYPIAYVEDLEQQVKKFKKSDADRAATYRANKNKSNAPTVESPVVSKQAWPKASRRNVRASDPNHTISDETTKSYPKAYVEYLNQQIESRKGNATVRKQNQRKKEKEAKESAETEASQQQQQQVSSSSSSSSSEQQEEKKKEEEEEHVLTEESLGSVAMDALANSKDTEKKTPAVASHSRTVASVGEVVKTTVPEKRKRENDTSRASPSQQGQLDVSSVVPSRSSLSSSSTPKRARSSPSELGMSPGVLRTMLSPVLKKIEEASLSARHARDPKSIVGNRMTLAYVNEIHVCDHVFVRGWERGGKDQYAVGDLIRNGTICRHANPDRDEEIGVLSLDDSNGVQYFMPLMFEPRHNNERVPALTTLYIESPFAPQVRQPIRRGFDTLGPFLPPNDASEETGSRLAHAIFNMEHVPDWNLASIQLLIRMLPTEEQLKVLRRAGLRCSTHMGDVERWFVKIDTGGGLSRAQNFLHVLRDKAQLAEERAQHDAEIERVQTAAQQTIERLRRQEEAMRVTLARVRRERQAARNDADRVRGERGEARRELEVALRKLEVASETIERLTRERDEAIQNRR